MKELDRLRNAFPQMPGECRAALMDTVRSVKEEERMKRKYPVAILVAAILTLMTTIALAEGWNVLAFLGLLPEGEANKLVQPVSASSGVGNVTLRIDSAITDGDCLAFDWTVENTKPETPVYLVVESFTANGEKIFIDGTDDFHNQWLPGWCNDGAMMDGEWCLLPGDLTGDTLHVEMTVGIYTPEKPVYLMEGFDAEAIWQKWDEGYYVIVDGDGMIFYDAAEDALFQGFPGAVLDDAAQGLLRSEMTICFDLDLEAARASVRHPELPAPVTKDGATLAVSSLIISPLQTHVVATFTPENAGYEDIVAWSDGMNFVLCDADGNELNEWDLAANIEGGASVREAADGTWYREWEMTYIGVTSAMPDEVILAYEKDDYRIEIPITLK